MQVSYLYFNAGKIFPFIYNLLKHYNDIFKIYSKYIVYHAFKTCILSVYNNFSYLDLSIHGIIPCLKTRLPLKRILNYG